MKPGYKQTKVGMIPDDWEVYALGDLCSFENGDRSSNYPSNSDFVSDGIPFINAGHVDNGSILFEDMNYITEEAYHRLTSGKVQTGDIVFCLRGSLGKFGVVSEILRQGAIASSLVIIRAREVRVHSGFLEKYLGSELCRAMIQTWAGGAAQPNLSAKELASFLVALPPALPEQRAIAAALADVDLTLAGLERLIAKKRDLKQAAMQQLLTGQTRLPGFSGAWEVKRLGEVAPFQRGFDLPTSQLQSGSVPVVYSNGILNHHNFAMAKGPGIVTGRSGTIGKVTYVEADYWPHNTSLWVTRFNGNHPRFLFYLYSTIDYGRLSSGSGVPTLNRNDLHDVELRIPLDHDEQVAITAVLSDMDAELSALKAQLNKTRLIKQAMMQELLTGRTRLPFQ